jgi:NAD(P)-dependent dehydrogenase (short-subunit alcohol dehydrogenase family)
LIAFKIDLNKSARSLFGVTNSVISPLPLTGKTVLVTGSGTGIGQAIATKFAQNGASIIIMGRRQQPLDETRELLLKTISSVGSSADVISFPGVDVSDEQSLLEMYNSIKQNSKRLDIIVNNAGVSGPVKVFTNADYSEFKECVGIHLTGTFLTSVLGLGLLPKNGTIVTISTYFTEESKYEQRPYRFRTPYTAAQGAKNRLAEALAWELVERHMKSVATNPGPVHSDRIYKTVYPKAAAEFLRIGGFKNMKAQVIEYTLSKILPFLGSDTVEIAAKQREIARELVDSKMVTNSDLEAIEHDISDLIGKLYQIAEKIQDNTKKMIVDSEFLTQEDVAEMVLMISSEKMSRLINGRIVPNDRVFYTVKPSISSVVQQHDLTLDGKIMLISTSSDDSNDIARIKSLRESMLNRGAKDVVVFSTGNVGHLESFSHHQVDLSNEENVTMMLNRFKSKLGRIDGLIHFTGRHDYNKSLLEVSKQQWEFLVQRFILIPALMTKQIAIAMAPEGALDEPNKFRNTVGNITIVGPDWPKGSKISGLVKARSELFRGALRPYVATVNQELSDVLDSRIRLYLVLPGSLDNGDIDEVRLKESIISLISRSDGEQHESIFYVGN